MGDDLARICLGAEKHPTGKTSSHRIGKTFERCDESIALATMYTANHFPGVKAIIALTESGYTPLIMSRIFAGGVIGSFALGGTALLIVVSVVVETMKQLEAQLMMRNYEGFIR